MTTEELVNRLMSCPRTSCGDCPMMYEEQVEQDLFRIHCAATDAAVEISRRLGPKTECGLFDQEEIHTDCTVQILRNSISGVVSIGWWENEKEV